MNSGLTLTQILQVVQDFFTLESPLILIAPHSSSGLNPIFYTGGQIIIQGADSILMEYINELSLPYFGKYRQPFRHSK